MNKKWTYALGILSLTASMAIADEEYSDDSSDQPEKPYHQHEEYSDNSSEQPEKPYRQHFQLYGDFLYWQASNTNAFWGLQNVTVDTQHLYLFHFNWDPGFRIGAAFKTTWEDLTFDVNWTKFHTTSTNTHQHLSFFGATASPNFTLYSLPFDDFSFGTPWRIRARYKIEFNQIDFTFRKALAVSKNFTLSPFGGLRAIITEHTLQATRYSSNYGAAPTTLAGPFNTSIINVKDYIKAIGLMGGFNANLKFGYGFGFYFGGDFFIGYGPDKTTNVSELSFGGVIANVHTLKQKTETTRMMYDLFTGFSWDTNFLDDKLTFLVSAGYEFHTMKNTPMFIYNGSDSEATFNNEPSKVTTFQGLTIRGGIGF